MARSKRPRKKYDPTKMARKWGIRGASNCVLYRWHSLGGDFIAHGPERYTERDIRHALGVTEREQLRWCVMVHAVYRSESGDISESQVDKVTEPLFANKEGMDYFLHLSEELEAVAKEDVDQEAEGLEYLDTVTMLRVWTPALESNLNSDSWVKRQALWRANLINQVLEENSELQAVT